MKIDIDILISLLKVQYFTISTFNPGRYVSALKWTILEHGEGCREWEASKMDYT